jgi:hypothetical protein
MSKYMLARLQLKYGMENLARYNEAMKDIRDFFERGGMRLRHGLITRVGPLYEVWNLWEIEDQGHIERVFEKAKTGDVQPKHLNAHRALQDVVVNEEVRFLEALPFSSGDGNA